MIIAAWWFYFGGIATDPAYGKDAGFGADVIHAELSYGRMTTTLIMKQPPDMDVDGVRSLVRFDMGHLDRYRVKFFALTPTECRLTLDASIGANFIESVFVNGSEVHIQDVQPESSRFIAVGSFAASADQNAAAKRLCRLTEKRRHDDVRFEVRIRRDGPK